MVDWKVTFLNLSRQRHDGYERPQESKINILRHVYNFVIGLLKMKTKKIGIPEGGKIMSFCWYKAYENCVYWLFISQLLSYPPYE